MRLKSVPPSPRATLSLCLAELTITGLVGEGRGETACLSAGLCLAQGLAHRRSSKNGYQMSL